MEDGEIDARLAGEDGEINDLCTDPVCAGRLAMALLDLINQNGWFEVGLCVTDGNLKTQGSFHLDHLSVSHLRAKLRNARFFSNPGLLRRRRVVECMRPCRNPPLTWR